MKRNLLIIFLCGLVFLVFLITFGRSGSIRSIAKKPSTLSAPQQLPINQNYGQLPLVFEPNQGQTDPRVKFLARGGGYALFLTPNEAVFVLRRGTANRLGNFNPSVQPQDQKSKKSEVLRLGLVGEHSKAFFEG